MIPYTIKDGQVRFNVHVVPGSSRSEVAGTHNDSLRVRVAARPVENAANEELILLLAKTFKVSKSSVRIVAGARGRAKQVSIAAEPEVVLEVLASNSRSEDGRQ
jgi:uncharacterized protein (TIGR00251 family)